MRETRTAIFIRVRRTKLRQNPARPRFAARHRVDDEERLRGCRSEAEVRWEIAAHFPPRIAAIVAAHDVPMLLHEEHVGSRRMQGDMVHAVANLGFRIGDALRAQALIDRSSETTPFNLGVERVDLGQRGFEVPDAREFPRMRRPTACRHRPTAESVDRTRYSGKEFPAGEMRARDLPLLTSLIRGHDERACASPSKHGLRPYGTPLCSCDQGFTELAKTPPACRRSHRVLGKSSR